MSFASSLLQDITILNGNDSSQLEDWLTDIKTASGLTGKITRAHKNINIRSPNLK